MTAPLCFQCKHFKQYQPLHFTTPGECKWEHSEPVPDWLSSYLKFADPFYGPSRAVSTKIYPVITECEAYAVLDKTENGASKQDD